jgi:organic hydroperoxide reductase OsmC/OhrA
VEDKFHNYGVTTTWTGNTGQGTANYRAYQRDHEISGQNKTIAIPGSSDAAFRGDPHRYNPEELLLSAASACHMLWMLHLCADAGIVVTAYVDRPTGVMVEKPDGSGSFSAITLHPLITITDTARVEQVEQLHHRAHEMCAIANSLNFPVEISPTTVAQS